ncbi:MAG TPA: C40 family peptidase [Gemmatimonadales bacterium]|nr:C40 family peptidase [Gemmatimonadales bacterium]
MTAQRADLSLLRPPVVHGAIGPLAIRATLGTGGVGVRVSARSAGPSRAAGGHSTARAAAVLNTADDHLGVPYRWGGTTPAGFDCSGFVQYVYRRHGVELPRTSRHQVRAGRVVSRRPVALRPGDLMFFASEDARIDHVAIYAGDNRIIHATASGGAVRYDDLSSARGQWVARRHVASRRVVENGRTLVRDLDLALRAAATLDPPDRAPRP